MPTSATGTRGEAGFTLVELMIVLAIIGLTSAAVILAFPDPRGGVASEAERLAARITFARDRAIMEARPVAVVITPGGYDFEQHRRREWEPVGDPPLVPHRLPEGIEAAVPSGGIRRITFDPTGLAEPAEIQLLSGDARTSVAVGGDGAVRVAS